MSELSNSKFTTASLSLDKGEVMCHFSSSTRSKTNLCFIESEQDEFKHNPCMYVQNNSLQQDHIISIQRMIYFKQIINLIVTYLFFSDTSIIHVYMYLYIYKLDQQKTYQLTRQFITLNIYVQVLLLLQLNIKLFHHLKFTPRCPLQLFYHYSKVYSLDLESPTLELYSKLSTSAHAVRTCRNNQRHFS